MNQKICHRCRIKPAEKSCKECQASLCTKCDNFVHSSLKRTHKREKIKNSSFSEQDTNYETNFKFYNEYSPSSPEKNNFKERKNNNDLKINSDYHDMNLTYNLCNKNKRKNFDENYNFENIKDIKLSNISSKNNQIQNNYMNNTQIPSMGSIYIKQIKEIYEQERKNLIMKINKLTQELDNTKKNLSERINYLHKHLYEVENKHELDLREQNNKNLIDSKKIEEEQNIKVTKMQNIISDQNNIINELKLKIKDLEAKINDKENSYLKSNRKIDNIISEKDALEKYYKNEIEQMKKKHTEEKESLISEYEHVINQISAELDINKKNYFNALKEIKEKEGMIQDVVDSANNEKEQMTNDIIKLKEQNNLEQNNLMEINSQLKYESENKTEEIEFLRNEIQSLTEENEIMKSKVKKMNQYNHGDRFSNSKINEIIRDTLSRKTN